MTMVTISSTSGGAAQLFGSIAVQIIEFPPICSKLGRRTLVELCRFASRLLCQGSLGELSRVRRVRTQWMSHFPTSFTRVCKNFRPNAANTCLRSFLVKTPAAVPDRPCLRNACAYVCVLVDHLPLFARFFRPLPKLGGQKS